MFEDLTESSDKSKGYDNELDAVCSICFGTGTRIDSEKGATACSCQTSSRSGRMFRAARIPARYADCSLDNFIRIPNSSQDEAFLFACRLVLDYPAIDRGLLFMGPAGVGKTHLAVSIMKGLLSKGFAAVFYEFGSLLKEIQDSYNPVSKTSELRVLAPVYQADLLVLDELGATVPTDWVRDTMYQIINKRYNDKKLTIFTTNYLDEPRINAGANEWETPRTFSKKVNADRIREMTTLEDRIGSRLRSRLYEMCHELRIEGDDYRRKQARDARTAG
jgi:DNA replication protein DnaC